MTATLTHFQKRLNEVGRTDRERAAFYRVSTRTIKYWRYGDYAPRLETVIRDPLSLAAVQADAEETARHAATADTARTAA